MQKLRRVAVVIETSRAYGRGLLRGVARYHQEHGGWAIYFKPHGLDEASPGWLSSWQGDGILARIASRKMADAVLKTGLPVVELRSALADLPMPSLGVDNLMVAKLAFDHLVERGLRQFAVCGLPRDAYLRMTERCDHFVQLVKSAGLECRVFEPPSKRRPDGTWDADHRKLTQWVRSLPTPIGIMACNDDRGLELLAACRQAGVLVPEQAAVISVDNDEYLCTLSMPPLSSVDIAPQRIGYAAAALLDELMAGATAPHERRLIPPGGVVVRQSTDVLATQDAAVVQAVSFIRTHACERIKIADVVDHVAMSRAFLEPRVKAVVGRTIHQEIQRVQVEQVKTLLADSDLSLKQITRRCGFKYPQYMARVFRQATGQTPLEFRRRAGK